MNTQILADLNWLAIVVAALVYFVLGAIWYSKALFGANWMVLANIDMTKTKGMGKMMSMTLVLILISCLGLALLVNRMDLSVLSSGLKVGLITGAGFAGTAVAISFVYESRPTALYLIDCGYHLLGHLAAAVILVLWR